MKRIALILATVMMLNGAAASAESGNKGKVQLNNGVVSVSGNVDSGKRVTIKVELKDDESNDISAVYEMAEVKVVDGKYTYSFIMPETRNGEETKGSFDVWVNGEKITSDGFVFASKAEREAFLSEITMADDAESIKAVLFSDDSITLLANFGVDAATLKNIHDEKSKDEFTEIFVSVKGADKVTIDNFGDILTNTMFLYNVNKQDSIAEYLTESDLSFEDIVFSQIQDEDLKKQIEKAIKENRPYKSKEEIADVYEMSNVLYLINEARYSQYEEIFEKYDDVIGVNSENWYKKYDKMSDTKKLNVNKAVKKVIDKNNVSDIDEFLGIFEECVEDELKPSSSGSGGGSTGSSKPSYPGGTSVAGGTVVNPGTGGMSITGTEEKKPVKIKFTDLSLAAWAEEAINGLVEKEIVSGYSDSTFKPNNSIKREEFVKIIVSALNLSLDTNPCDFEDIDQSMWYAPYVNAAVKKGIISGVSETEFGIGREITRQDMATIVKRAAGKLSDEKEYVAFTDEEDISEYAKEAVIELFKAGKISGMGNNRFEPKGIVTRAQAAKVVYDTFVK